MNNKKIERLLEDIGNNTHTARLIQSGRVEDALAYMERHELADGNSYYSTSDPRLHAYLELVAELEKELA